MVQPTNNGFDDLYNTNTEMVWNSTANDGKGCPYRPGTKAWDYTTAALPADADVRPDLDAAVGTEGGADHPVCADLLRGNVGNNGNPAFMARFLGYVTPQPGGTDDSGGSGGPVEGPIVKKLRLVK